MNANAAGNLLIIIATVVCVIVVGGVAIKIMLHGSY